MMIYQGTGFILRNCLLQAMKLIKNDDSDKCECSGYSDYVHCQEVNSVIALLFLMQLIVHMHILTIEKIPYFLTTEISLSKER